MNECIRFNISDTHFVDKEKLPICDAFLYSKSHPTASLKRDRDKGAVIATEEILGSVDECKTCIHKNWWYNYNKVIHNEALYIFDRIYYKS